MAEAYGKLTRRPAVCMGTRMVGAGNLAIGIHTARQDSTPLIALLGQVATEFRYREAFQEVDLPHAFAPVAKWAVEPPSADRLGELTLQAGRTAVSGRPGPVVVALREDLLNEPVGPLDAQPVCAPRPAPATETVAQILALLRAAERPVMLLGQGVLASGASQACVRLAEAEQVPVIAAWRRPDVFPNAHPLYVGHSGIGAPRCVPERLLAADLVLAIGVRLDEQTTFGYRVPSPTSRLVHVDLAAEDLGGHRQADVSCVSDAALFVEALLSAEAASPPPTRLLAARQARNAADRATWDEQTTPTRGRARPGFVDQQAVVAHLRTALPPDTIVTTDAGNFGMWPARYLRWNRPGTFLGATSGPMGYAIPAAFAARLARPAQPVVAFVGDGGFLMTGTEIETAVRENAPLVALVYDNAQYGTIRMHQQREHPGRPIATALGPVDIAAFARSLGGLGIAVRDDREFPSAFAEALRAGRPAVLHLRIDPEQLSVADDDRPTADS
jgi:acetolactate synthase-1/2/3 large subunit